MSNLQLCRAAESLIERKVHETSLLGRSLFWSLGSGSSRNVAWQARHDNRPVCLRLILPPWGAEPTCITSNHLHHSFHRLHQSRHVAAEWNSFQDDQVRSPSPKVFSRQR